MPDVSLFDKVKIGIASSQDILSWSHGEVKKPETINYRTFKPERDGLFCEKIFGPTKDWECQCGKYKKIKFEGQVCERCLVEVTRSRVRRERMGHVELAAPVCHIWYLKGIPSPLSLVLDISPKLLEKVVYFASYIIIDIDGEKIQSLLPRIREAVEIEKRYQQAAMRELEEESFDRLTEDLKNNREEYDETFARERAKAVNDRIKAEYRDADDKLKDLDIAVEVLGKLERNQLIDEDKYRAVTKLLDAVGMRLNENLRELVNADIGARAVRELLNRVDLESMARGLRQEIVMTQSTKRARAIKRLEVVEALISSKSRPEWMVLDVVPVISPDLRPMVQLDGGRFATSDLNDLYRRIINRNNRLKKIQEIRAPESIIHHEMRLLQEAVDSLIDNSRRARPVVGSSQRPLKSLSDMLKGKEGRFRKNLLGKRVDYSGRSVIVVGPHLKLHQCGIPKEMALELFKPFVMKTLVERKITPNIKTAKRMIDRMHPAVWDGLEEVIKEHPVLLNRAPTLHRLGIQAFEPILVDGKAIQVHPLVCNMYNADFDGDQMAVHVPLSTMAQSEARVLMLSTQNLFSPADGRPTCAPVQDIVLGNYALTMISREGRARLEAEIAAHAADRENAPAPRVFTSTDEVLYLLDSPSVERRLHLNEPVLVRLKRPVMRPDAEIAFRDPATGAEYEKVTRVPEDGGTPFDELVPLEMEHEDIVVSITPGQIRFHNMLPYPMRYADELLNIELDKKQLSAIILTCHRRAGMAATIKLLDDLKDLGFRSATEYGLTVAITDMDPPERREEMIKSADDQSNRFTTSFRRGLMNYTEMQSKLTALWQETYDKVGKEIQGSLTQFNPLSITTVSGARGSIKQLAQLSGMRGLMLNQFNETIYELPVKSSFHKGLTMLEYFVTTHGARKGLADTALRTADAGYLTRRLCDVAQDVIVKADDCGTTDGALVHRLVTQGQTIEPLTDRLHGRVALAVITHPETGEPLSGFQELISKEAAAAIDRIEDAFYKELAGIKGDPERDAIIERYKSYGFEADEHGMLSVNVRSPLTCELEQGICAKCYGADLSSGRVVEVGVAVGIIAAQSIGEPGTQLTMRTFHTGGVAGSSTIARTNQYKTGRFLRQFMEDYGQATETDMKSFDPTKLIETQEKMIKEMFQGGANAAPLTINVEEPTEDPKAKRKAERVTKAAQKAADKADSDSRKKWDRARKTFFYAWSGESGGIVRVEEIFEARRQPRGKAVISPVSGTVRAINKSNYGRFVLIGATVPTTAPVKEATISDDQPWPKDANGDYDKGLQRVVGQKLTTATLTLIRRAEVETVNIFFPILVPPYGNLPVEVGGKIVKGDPLTEGPRDPHEVLELAGASAVFDYFVENLQAVYKAQGVDINDKHVEVIIRQMLRKRTVKEPGDTPFLPGQIVDRFTFQRANDAVREAIAEGKKIRYTDPVTGEAVERDPKEATTTWILLGITEASLATDSFLSAASFQKTTRVLTDAAVRGKRDQLVGLKENVIIGRLIPAGTGVKQYRDIEVHATAAPAPHLRSLRDMAAEEFGDGSDDVYAQVTGRSLADIAGGEDLPDGFNIEDEA